MKILNVIDFMKKYTLKNETMSESQLKKYYSLSHISQRFKKIFA